MFLRNANNVPQCFSLDMNSENNKQSFEFILNTTVKVKCGFTTMFAVGIEEC